MKDLLDKLSSYNIFNFLFPGIIFTVVLKAITPYSLVQNDLVLGVFVYYFIGMAVSRFGSLIIEPLLKKISFLKFSDYKEFVSASKKDEKIEVLSEVNNMYRTLCAMFILLGLLKLYAEIENKFALLKSWNTVIVVILLLIMSLFSYRKQTEYINKRVEVNK